MHAGTRKTRTTHLDSKSWRSRSMSDFESLNCLAARRSRASLFNVRETECNKRKRARSFIDTCGCVFHIVTVKAAHNRDAKQQNVRRVCLSKSNVTCAAWPTQPSLGGASGTQERSCIDGGTRISRTSLSDITVSQPPSDHLEFQECIVFKLYIPGAGFRVTYVCTA